MEQEDNDRVHGEQSESALSRIGGPDALRAIVDDFIDRVTSDMMIGFFFRQADKKRLKQLEFEFAMGHLGGNVPYSGRPMRQAHSGHRIMGGQFNRRLVILEKTLRAHQVPEDVIAEWLAHTESLRAQVTTDPSGECIGGPAPK